MGGCLFRSKRVVSEAPLKDASLKPSSPAVPAVPVAPVITESASPAGLGSSKPLAEEALGVKPQVAVALPVVENVTTDEGTLPASYYTREDDQQQRRKSKNPRNWRKRRSSSRSSSQSSKRHVRRSNRKRR